MARALYIHWPFCEKKCPYCDFNSHVRATVDDDLWAAALLADMRFEHGESPQGPLASIFFGGGTPSLMPPAIVGSLIAEADRLWGLAPDCEITLEANPSSVEAARFADIAAAGVNRVSLGLQALNDEALARLGRLHNTREALAALDTAQDHFGRVSFDLIYARPDQTAAQWEADLARALGFGTWHMSLYQLTIEPGTRYATDVRRGVFAPMDDDEAADLFAITRELTVAAGIPAYEISNHARAGEESRHNLTYWRYGDYCGIGPGAHGRRGGSATQRHRKPENFLAAIDARGDGLLESRKLGLQEQASEALLMGLRLAEGVDLDTLASRFRTTTAELIDTDRAAFYEQLGMLERTGSHLTVTPDGMPLLDGLLGEIVPAELVAG
ncbi:radical SAM family heme chaperone HemW [Alteripontixanthobacter maritimus]|uniref:radical SAM family heme chaperone HemW n=1 Tax=Alteripontixanthobacter maritimus TaxID=2161824 RepID=UPI000E1BE216|nr:radical SAM family heme chaperone HemW [Alteripontixanthobacter maritimus]